jgi:hypothetical protein
MRILLALLLSCGPLLADLAQAQAEPNLEKRSRVALENAERALKASRHAYTAGDVKEAASLLDELGESVELAEKSLEATGKDPIKSPKYFKSAEIKTGALVRGIDAFSRDMSVDDRPMAEKIREKVQETHDRLLQGIMVGRKK